MVRRYSAIKVAINKPEPAIRQGALLSIMALNFASELTRTLRLRPRSESDVRVE